jgi:hypothetical protein
MDVTVGGAPLAPANKWSNSYAPPVSGAELRSARVGTRLGQLVNTAEVGFSFLRDIFVFFCFFWFFGFLVFGFLFFVSFSFLFFFFLTILNILKI